MNARLSLPLGLLQGLSALTALGGEPPDSPTDNGPHDVHINMNVSDSVDSDGGSISMARNKLVVKVKGNADAKVASDGGLSIDGTPVAVSDDGRQALKDYYSQGKAVVDQGKAMGKEGVYFAFNTMGNVFASLLTGSEREADKRVEKDARDFQNRAEALCASLDALRQAQDAAGKAVPEFVPYAGVVTAKSVDDCNQDARNGVQVEDAKH